MVIGLLATWNQGNIWVSATAKVHVWVPGPTARSVVMSVLFGYYQRYRRLDYSELAPHFIGCSAMENWSCASPAAALQRRPALYLGSAVELTLSAWVQRSLLEGNESAITGPTICPPCGGCGQRRLLPLSQAPRYLQQAGKRPWVMTVEELALSLTSCRTWECRWYTLAGEHSSADRGCQGDLDLTGVVRAIWT